MAFGTVNRLGPGLLHMGKIEPPNYQGREGGALVRASRFELDKVDGQVVPSRLSLPYQFGGGAAKRPEGNNKRGAKPPSIDLASMPVMTAVSAVPGIELAKLDYKAPEPAAPAK